MENIFQKLECPFTWNMEKLIIYLENYGDPDIGKQNKNSPLNDGASYPDIENSSLKNASSYLQQLNRSIMRVFKNTKAKMESTEILNDLKKCDDVLMSLKKCNHQEISIDVIHFILQSTECFVLKELNLTEELDLKIQIVKPIATMNSKQTSTLKACKSMCWTLGKHKQFCESENFIRSAIRDNPNCDIWYHCLGKTLCFKRKNSHFISDVKTINEEIHYLKIGYNMGRDPQFGAYLAQTYRETQNFKEALKIYYRVFDQNPEQPIVLLRLALGFISFKHFDAAKACLDKVETLQPHRSMYLHYRGTYHLKRQEYEKAANYLQEACREKNMAAEMQYLECVEKIDTSFDIIGHFHDLLDRYKDSPKRDIQLLYLYLALIYWKRKHDVIEALEYFFKAMEINPGKCVNMHHPCKFVGITDKNIYKILNFEFLPLILTNKDAFSKSCIDKALGLQKYSKEYFFKNEE